MSSKDKQANNSAAEIARLEAEITAIERIGPPLAELQDAAVHQLERAEEFYRRRGLPWQQGAMTTGETMHALIGFLMASNSEPLIEAEKRRVEVWFNARGGRGMTAEAKAQALASLRADLRRQYARREIEWRRREAAGAEVERSDADVETFLARDTDLAEIAAGGA